jgi:hypothetical protein
VEAEDFSMFVRYAALVALGILAYLSTGATARADSIVYIRAQDSSLWTAAANGSHAHMISSQAMQWPTKADNGTVVAVGPGRRAPDGSRGADIWVFGPSGQLDHRIPTPADYSTLSCPTFAPSHSRISPDGSKIAYDVFMCDHFTTFWTPASARKLDWPNQKLGQEGTIMP